MELTLTECKNINFLNIVGVFLPLRIKSNKEETKISL